MRTQNIKFLRTDDGRLFMFRYSGGSIYAKILYKNVPSQSLKAADNVSPIFSVWSFDNLVYLICLGNTGVTLCLYRDGQWVSRPLSRNTDDEFSKMSFISLNDTAHLVYSVRQGDFHSLHIRSAKRDQWGMPLKIDDMIPFSETPFYIGRENRNTVRIYYRTTEKDIKFRRFNLESGSLSERYDLISANMPATDISVLTGENECHILYLVKGPFSSQLIYKGIKNASSSKVKIIWEGQLSGSCSLLKNEGRLYALIYDRTKCFAAFSDDNGYNFSIPKNLGVRMGDSCLKAEYTDFSENSFSADEIPTDISDFSFPITEDIFPSFIPKQNENREMPQKQNMFSGNVAGGNMPSQSMRQGNMAQANMFPENMMSQNTPVKNPSESRIAELNERINELSGLLSKRNDEIAAISSSWKLKYDALLKENTALRALAEKSHSAVQNSSDALTLSASDSGASDSGSSDSNNTGFAESDTVTET